MRPRAIAFAAACALTLLLTTPDSASAAIGDFHYTYVDAAGAEQREKIDGRDYKDDVIPDGVCIDIKEAEDPAKTKPAHSPLNSTNTRALVFEEESCVGARYVLAADGKGGVNLKFRSVLFQA
ncbi:hypothetical protein ACFQ6V_17400 [Streptomyces roseifaciens]